MLAQPTELDGSPPLTPPVRPPHANKPELLPTYTKRSVLEAHIGRSLTSIHPIEVVKTCYNTRRHVHAQERWLLHLRGALRRT